MERSNFKKLILKRLKSQGALKIKYDLPNLINHEKPITFVNLSSMDIYNKYDILLKGPNFIPPPSTNKLIKNLSNDLETNHKYLDNFTKVYMEHYGHQNILKKTVDQNNKTLNTNYLRQINELNKMQNIIISKADKK